MLILCHQPELEVRPRGTGGHPRHQPPDCGRLRAALARRRPAAPGRSPGGARRAGARPRGARRRGHLRVRRGRGRAGPGPSSRAQPGAAVRLRVPRPVAAAGRAVDRVAVARGARSHRRSGGQSPRRRAASVGAGPRGLLLAPGLRRGARRAVRGRRRRGVRLRAAALLRRRGGRRRALRLHRRARPRRRRPAPVRRSPRAAAPASTTRRQAITTSRWPTSRPRSAAGWRPPPAWPVAPPSATRTGGAAPDAGRRPPRGLRHPGMRRATIPSPPCAAPRIACWARRGRSAGCCATRSPSRPATRPSRSIPPRRGTARTKIARGENIASAEPLFEVRMREGEAEATVGPRASELSLAPAARDLSASSDVEWAIKMIDAPEAWGMFGPTGRLPGEGITIGHPDTGYTRHPEIFPGRIRLEGAYDFFTDDGDPPTSCSRAGRSPPRATGPPPPASSVSDWGAQRPASGPYVTGVAPRASVVPFRVMKSPVLWSTRNVTAAIDRASAIGCHVISMSLGTGLWWEVDALREAIRRAVRQGVIVVAAAGNYVGPVTWPGRFDEVVCVAACNAAKRPWFHSCAGSAVRPDRARRVGVAGARRQAAGRAAVRRGAQQRHVVPDRAGGRGRGAVAVVSRARQADRRPRGREPVRAVPRHRARLVHADGRRPRPPAKRLRRRHHQRAGGPGGGPAHLSRPACAGARAEARKAEATQTAEFVRELQREPGGWPPRSGSAPTGWPGCSTRAARNSRSAWPPSRRCARPCPRRAPAPSPRPRWPERRSR